MQMYLKCIFHVFQCSQHWLRKSVSRLLESNDRKGYHKHWIERMDPKNSTKDYDFYSENVRYRGKTHTLRAIGCVSIAQILKYTHLWSSPKPLLKPDFTYIWVNKMFIRLKRHLSFASIPTEIAFESRSYHTMNTMSSAVTDIHWELNSISVEQTLKLLHRMNSHPFNSEVLCSVTTHSCKSCVKFSFYVIFIDNVSYQ